MRLNHWVVYASIAVGVLSVAPYLVAYFFIPSEVAIRQSEKLHFFYQDSELIYLGRIREVMEGEWGISSLAFLEYKKQPVIQQPFGEWLYVAISFGNTSVLPIVAVVTKGVFPAVLFFLLFICIKYFLLKEEISSTLAIIISATLAWLISSGLDVYRPNHLVDFFLSGNTVSPYLSIWTRIVNPITGMLGLATVILLLAYRSGPFRFYPAIMLGLVAGLSSGYVFSFAIMAVYATGTAFLWLLYKEWARIKEGIIALIILILLNYSFIVSTFSTLGSKSESLGKNGLFHTSLPLINKGVLLGLFVWTLSLLYFVYIEKNTLRTLLARPWWRFSAAFLFAAGVCYSQQILTGKTVWPQHFIQYTDPFMLIVTGGSLALVFIKAVGHIQKWKPDYSQWVVSMSAVIIIGTVTMFQISTIATVFSYSEEYSDSQRYIAAINWLNGQQVDVPCVVFPLETTERIERYIFAYTGCDLYHSNFVYMSVPETRVFHNYVAQLRLLGITSENISTHLDENFSEWQHLFFKDWYDKFSEKPDPWLQSIAKPNQKEDFYISTKANIEASFNASLEIPIEEWLLKYQLNYLIVDHKHDDIVLDERLFIPRITSNQITIYEFVVQ